MHGPILCVDDEPRNLALLREILQDDYPLTFAVSGEKALQAAHKQPPSLVLLDVMMPDMDGYQVCQRLKANPATAEIPVIFVTALAEPANELEGFKAGGVDYIAKPFSSAVVRARVKTHLSLVRSAMLEKSHREAIYMLSVAGHYHEINTGADVWRVGAYCKLLAESLGWPQAHCELLELAAPLRDIGMLAIPDAIRDKPGKLDADEFAIVKRHTRIGAEIFGRSEAPLFQLAAEIALGHHERWDGSGYPAGLAGAAIPESARIVAVADVFHALSMRRPYKEPWPVERILAYLRQNAGLQFEQAIVDALIDNLSTIIPSRIEFEVSEHTAAPAAPDLTLPQALGGESA